MKEEDCKIHKYGENLVRTITDENNEKFVCVADLAKVMKMADGRITRIPYPCHHVMIETAGGNQPVKMIGIDHVIALLFRSRRPEAEAVRLWFMKEIVGTEKLEA